MPSWAIVVGINDYPETGLGKLQGAVADACDFAEWVLDPAGGAVPRTNLFFWTYPWPGATDDAGQVLVPLPDPASELGKYLGGTARPDWKRVVGGPGVPDEDRAPHAWEIVKTIEKAGRDAYNAAKEAELAGEGDPNEERRVFVFLAGHGVSAKESGGDFQTCFVAGNFEPAVGENVGGLVASVSLRASLFSGRFTEVLQFLDCCRLKPSVLPVSAAPICDALFSASGTRWGLGLAAEPDQAAFEINAPPMRGAFSKVLVDGLRHYREPLTGELRIADLDKYVASNIRLPPGEKQTPKFSCQDPPGDPLIVKSEPTAQPGPMVDLSALPAGTKVILLDGSLKPVPHVGPLEAGPDPIPLPPLTEGLYVLVVDEAAPARRAMFQQPLVRTVDVE